ncbi:prepilin-type N-terminal cleavage/methylation domain-containing protein [Paenibacillus validus]|uniref:prepilin-type N-terminal cleavage/methylation domain-containing protein n=1 Tax=Paenibacillus TaxID=44249 RepID=UPI0006D0FC84|nr:prepilin-type N-terminal cleavage/methylation domain-containing protein [Paenibacillus validus]MED4603470.1 prepilin-type N-terminal cleavage/methylation domain-containing protein [Paenibacillus validus]MED4608838.1 prepilin-type N-terminal cleavage/methylation domain-containing protein [Paenibacillus validus]
MNRLNERGLSLVELLAAITIAAIVIGVVSSAIFQTYTGFATVTARESTQENARLVTEHIVNRVREQPYVISQSDENFLELTAPDGNPDTPDDFVHYRREGTNLSVITRANNRVATTLIATNVTEAHAELIDAHGQIITGSSPLQAQAIRISLNFRTTDKHMQHFSTTISIPSWNQYR